ncbi:hypothetical protein UA08_07331 [Talaromyces atroroseus]|uniref:Uncharacterized protein n=1 Tax=Talaromyces atroroseus TaxID=1441469 RepID=A0A225ADV4_TALAT|nr:hypothetical protein UA08_07331 [Talaromyces atroroseus]OKL57183.1 hypothetical protein UA08_07331 [Talaromyces atroroseus]
MLQTFLTPEKLWPGGIPPSVHLHQNGDLSEDDMKEESKGWCQRSGFQRLISPRKRNNDERSLKDGLLRIRPFEIRIKIVLRYENRR